MKKDYVKFPDGTVMSYEAMEKYHEIKKGLLQKTLKEHLEIFKEKEIEFGTWERYNLNLDELCFEKAEITKEYMPNNKYFKTIYSVPYKGEKKIEVTALFKEEESEYDDHSALVCFFDKEAGFEHSISHDFDNSAAYKSSTKTKEKLWELLMGTKKEVLTILKKEYPQFKIDIEL